MEAKLLKMTGTIATDFWGIVLTLGTGMQVVLRLPCSHYELLGEEQVKDALLCIVERINHGNN